MLAQVLKKMKLLYTNSGGYGWEGERVVGKGDIIALACGVYHCWPWHSLGFIIAVPETSLGLLLSLTLVGRHC